MTFTEYRSTRTAIADISAVAGYDLNEDGSPAPGFVYAPEMVGGVMAVSGWIQEVNHPTLGRYFAQIESGEVWSDDLATVEFAVYEWAVVACGA